MRVTTYGQYSGLQKNGASIVPDPTYGHVLNLNGTNQYVWLPPGVGYGETFAAVVKWRRRRGLAANF